MVGAVARLLRYGAWIGLVNLYLVQIPKHPENERYLISALCSILGAFHEDLTGEGSSVEGVKRGLEKLIPKVERLLHKETTKAGSKVKTLRSSVVLALLTLFQKASLMEAKFSGLVLVVCKSLRSKESDSRDVARSVLAKIVLAVGVGVGLGEVVHQLAVSLGEGYQLHIRAAALHSILLALSKHSEVVARIHDNGDLDECVPAIMDLVQQDVFGLAAEMKEVKDAEKRVIKEAIGVKSYDTLEILASMIRFRPSETTSETTLSAVHAVVTPFVERLKSEGDASKLGMTIKKCRACLDRVVIGFGKNTDASGPEVLKFVWATIAVFLGGGGKRKREDVEDEDEDGDLESSDEEDEEGEKEGIKITSKSGKMKAARKEKKGEGKKSGVQTWQPSLQEVHNSKSALAMKRDQSRAQHKVRDGVNAPKMTGANRHGVSQLAATRNINNPAVAAAVVFGLRLLHACLKKSKLDWNDATIKAMADPFVGLLTRCVRRSTSDEIVLLAIRSLGFLLRWVSREKDDSEVHLHNSNPVLSQYPTGLTKHHRKSENSRVF